MSKTRTKAQLHSEALRCLTLHNQGMTHRQIAQVMTEEGMPISQPTVTRRIELALSLYVVPGLDQARAQELARLDTYLQSLSSAISSGDINAIKTAVTISAQRSKMLGLEKKETTAPVPVAPAPSILGMVNSARLRVVGDTQ